MTGLSGNDLARLEGHPFEPRYRKGARAEAVRLAELAKAAYEYFTRVFLDTSLEITALFLTPADWTRGYRVPDKLGVGLKEMRRARVRRSVRARS